MKNKLYTFLFAIIFIVFLSSSQPVRAVSVFDCAAVTVIPQTECQALVALYNNTNGPGWINSTNWLVDPNPGVWYGVTVGSGFVTQLTLPENGLSGVIPIEMGSLTHLTSLDMGGNQIGGTIPAALGNLTSLTYLDLGYNLLNGSIPSQLGNLILLEHLYLNSNQLDGTLPPELGNLIKLSRLWLYDNLLSGSIPTTFGQLTNMLNFWLSGNALTGSIPVELQNWTKLEWLRLADNQLSGAIPPQLGLLTGLRQISLGNNQLTGEIPLALGNLTNLMILSLGNNQLSGSIPSQLGNLTNLYELDLSSNQLSGSIPLEFGNLIGLEYLLLDDNQLSGNIPTGFGNLTDLIYLLLDRNQLSGDIPDLTNLGNLLLSADPDGPGLDLDYNSFTVPDDYPNPLNPAHVFLSDRDPNWHTLQGFDQIVFPYVNSVLTSLDGRTIIYIPQYALSVTAIFTFTPLPDPSYPPGTLVDAHNSFKLTAEDESGTPVTTFNQPLNATFYYSDSDVLGLFESSLALYYYDTGAHAWQDAANTCYPPGIYTRDPVTNTLMLPLCHLSDFSLLGTPTPRIFLPMIVR